MARKLEWDRVLFMTVVALVLFGALMVYSASAVMSLERHQSSYHYLVRQVAWAAVGFAAMVALMNVDYRRLRKPDVVFPVLALQLILLLAALFAGRSHNAHRWVHLGSASFEPSELSKIAVVLFLAHFLDLRKGAVNDFKHTLLPVGLITALTVALIVMEPDLGTSLALIFIVAAMLFAAGLNARYFVTPVLAALPVFYFFVYRVPWRWKRVLAFLNPETDPKGYGFQIIQSKIAVATGGISGVGLMEGKQKLFFLPEPHNDFVFAVISEELGFLGALVVLALFAVVLWRGLRAALNCADNAGCLLAIGLTVLLVSQALVNISVVLGLLPTKGIPLPFVSYGGSSLLVNLIAVGMLLNISQHAT